jgi:DNA-binding SARP family transcriptional activator
MYNILKSKLRPPAASWAAVERAILLLRLDAAAADPALRVLLLVAAAGYSKTTVLAEWTGRLAARGVPIAWYSLSPGDRALPVFRAYLEAAVRAALPGFPTVLPRGGDGPFAPAPDSEELREEDVVAVAAALAPLLAGLEAVLPPAVPGRQGAGLPRLVIVLDDVHHLTGQHTLDAALSLLISHLPPGVVLALAARRELGRGVPLARLRQGHGLHGLHEPDLRLLPSETMRAYPDLAPTLAHSPDVQHLVAQLEGWPAGLALLHDRVIEGRGTGDGLLLRRVREDLYTYLEEEVLAGVTEPLYSFLLRTAILDALTVPACNAVTGLTGSDVLLTQAMHHHLFLRRTGIEPPVYTYHPLFREYLLQRLRQMYGTGEHRRLNRAAAVYYAGEEAWITAGHHFLAAGDLDGVEMAVEVLRERGGGTVPLEDSDALGAALRDVGDPAARRHLVQRLGTQVRAAEGPLLQAFTGDADPAVRAAAEQGMAAVQGRASGVLRIEMFGGLRVWRGDQPIEARDWHRRRARRLLVYLLLAGPDGASREQIAEKVWPEARPTEAEALFYAHLRASRAVLEPAGATNHAPLILRDRGRYAFNFSLPHQWDVAEFQQHRDAGRRAERLDQPEVAAAAYRAALACYTGDLLPDRDLAEVPWLLARRAAYRDDAQAMHRTLAEQAAAHGAWEEAIRHWQDTLALAPAAEEIHVRLMTIYAALGRPEDALAQFRTLRAALHRAHGTTPAPATLALYEQIRAHTPAP